MNTQDQLDHTLAYLLLRLMLGVNMLMHGLSRLLAGPATFATSLVHAFQSTPLPPVLVQAFALSLPRVEAAIGLLLLLGLFRRPVLLAGGALLIALTFGSTLRQDWQSSGLQLIYALLYAVLLAFLRCDRFHLDALFRSHARGAATRELT